MRTVEIFHSSGDSDNHRQHMAAASGHFLHKAGIMLAAAAFLLMSCSRLPLIKPVAPDAADRQLKQCMDIFPGEKIRLIHAIEASMEGGARTTQLGVLIVDPGSRAIHSVLMTLEGFVLFDAEDKGRITINRAVPPFDTMIFAEKLMSDIRLAFLRPAFPVTVSGVVTDGTPVCRFRTEQGMTQDIALPLKTTDREIRLYTEQNELARKVTVHKPDNRGISEKIVLEAYGFREYSLQMRLITAETLTDENREIKTKENQ